jgi:hypothetical protein
MATENEQFGFQDRIDDIRKELDAKIEKKTSEGVFKWAVGLIATVILTIVAGGIAWFINVNERLTRVETKIEMNQQVDRQVTGRR